MSLLVCILVLTAVPIGTQPAFAFTEGSSNNFFGTGAGVATTGNSNNFFGGGAGEANTSGSRNSFFGDAAGRFNTAGSNNSFFGREAGSNNVTSLDNSFFGAFAGRNNTAAGNSFFGLSAGNSNTSGSQNAFFGFTAGGFNTTGGSNSFFGYEAGLNNTTGSGNSFFGFSSGRANTTGIANAFFGVSSGTSNTTGNENAFFGTGAGASNTTGSENSFVGRDAGLVNASGSRNTFVGRSAGMDNAIGTDNAFFGSAAGRSNTLGGGNTMVGAESGILNTTGVFNTFLGVGAGTANTNQDFNTFLGSVSNGAVGITNATAVGHQAQVSQSNSLVLGSINALNGAASDTRVGIGTPSPDDALHVFRSDGTAKVLVEEASGVLLGRELFQLVNNGASRFRVSNSNNGATWDFQSSGGGGSFVIDRVGGPASLDFEVQPDGDLVMRGSVTGTSFISSSDRNLKTDITPANARTLMAMLRKLDISTWRFKTDPKGTMNLGPMAQDFHRLFGMGTETTIDVRDLAALALVASQTQQKEIDQLKRAVAELSRT